MFLKIERIGYIFDLSLLFMSIIGFHVSLEYHIVTAQEFD